MLSMYQTGPRQVSRLVLSVIKCDQFRNNGNKLNEVFFVSKETPVGQHVRDAIRKAKLQREVLRQHTGSPTMGTLRAREEHSKSSAEARYKVVAQKRALGWDELDTEKKEDEKKDAASEEEKQDEAFEEGQKLFHLLDLVNDIPVEVTTEKVSK